MINYILTKKEKNETAIVFNKKQYSYTELLELIYKAERYFLDQSILKGDRVILLGENSIEFIISIFALNNINAIFVILDFNIIKEQFSLISDEISPEIVLIDDSILEQGWLLHSSAKKIIKTSELLHNIKKYSSSTTSEYQVSLNDVACIIYTSGSTGRPKGVVSQNKNIFFCVDEINNELKYEAHDIVINGLSISFDYGLYQIFLTLSVGATLVLEKSFNNLISFPRLLLEYKVTIFPIVPTIINTLLCSRLLERVSLPCLQKITSTGDILHKDTINRLQLLFPSIKIYSMYGITECKRVSILSNHKIKSKPGSVGKPLKNILAFIDENNQLIVSGDNVMAGYWNRTKDDKSKGTFFKTIKGKRYLYTGDYFEQDDEGFLYFLGRKDDVVKINAKKYFLRDIEGLIIKNFKYIREISLIYQASCMYIFIYSTEPVPKKILISVIKEQFSININPQNINTRKTPLPKNSNGKFDKKKLLKNEHI